MTLTFLLLVPISICAVVATVALVVTTSDLRRMVRQINRLLPDWERTLKEARQAFSQTHELLARSNRVVREGEALLGRVSEVVSNVFHPFLLLEQKARKILSGHGWNGKSGFRRHVSVKS